MSTSLDSGSEAHGRNSGQGYDGASEVSVSDGRHCGMMWVCMSMRKRWDAGFGGDPSFCREGEDKGEGVERDGDDEGDDDDDDDGDEEPQQSWSLVIIAGAIVMMMFYY